MDVQIPVALQALVKGTLSREDLWSGGPSAISGKPNSLLSTTERWANAGSPQEMGFRTPRRSHRCLLWEPFEVDVQAQRQLCPLSKGFSTLSQKQPVPK